MRQIFWIIPIITAATIAIAGTNNLPSETSRVIQRDHINKFATALSGDLVPRNASGTVADLAGSLGMSTYRFLKEFVASGGWSIGDIKEHHSYNGLTPAGEGWMLCDGRVINQTNYDTEHGTGHWAIYVVSSKLDGKYLPPMTNRYLIGKATTPQSGSSAITSVGNASSNVNLTHNHSWYRASSDQQYFYNDVSSPVTPDWEGAASVGILFSSPNGTYNAVAQNGKHYYTDYGLGITNIQPDSVEVQYYMRIVE